MAVFSIQRPQFPNVPTSLTRPQASQPFDADAAVRFLAKVKGWKPSGEGGAWGAPRISHDPPPPALLQKVAAVMSTAVAKYDILTFIKRQHRSKNPPPQPSQPQQRGPVETAACEAASKPASAAARADGGEGPSGAAAVATGWMPTATYAPPYGSTPYSMQFSPSMIEVTSSPRVVTGTTTTTSKISHGLELRLRAHLSHLGCKKLRRRNVSEGVGWTLLDLVAKDWELRLQRVG